MKEFILKYIKISAKFMKTAAQLAKAKTATSSKYAAKIMKSVTKILDILTKSASKLTGVNANIIKVALAGMVVSAGVLYNSVKQQPPAEQPPAEQPPAEQPPAKEPPPKKPPPEMDGKFLFSSEPYKQCISNNMPSYLNNSMTWGAPHYMGAIKAFKAISPPTIIVTSGGNNARKRPFTDQNKVRGSKEFDAIIVGSLSSYGHRSSFSQKGEEVTIMAPSNYELTSADRNGKYKRFSGTSGAAPLVTGSLAAFSWMSGYQPTAKEAKLLLKKTAIPLRTSNADPQLNGPGMLNTYKLGMVGKRLREQCGADIECFKNLIQQDSTYEFPEEEGVMEMVEQAFPECSATKCLERSNKCKDKALALEKLRKAAFLNPSSNEEKWRYLSCIYSSGGFADNAKGMKSIYEALLGAPPAEGSDEKIGNWLAGYRNCETDDDCGLVPSCHNTSYYHPANKNYVMECQGPILCNGNCRCNGELKKPALVFNVRSQPRKIIKSTRAVCVNQQCEAQEFSPPTPSEGSGAVQ